MAKIVIGSRVIACLEHSLLSTSNLKTSALAAVSKNHLTSCLHECGVIPHD